MDRWKTQKLGLPESFCFAPHTNLDLDSKMELEKPMLQK